MKPNAYGPFPYSPIIRRPRLTWPNNARVALWVIPNIEFFSLEERRGAPAAGKFPTSLCGPQEIMATASVCSG